MEVNLSQSDQTSVVPPTSDEFGVSLVRIMSPCSKAVSLALSARFLSLSGSVISCWRNMFVGILIHLKAE